MSIIGEFYHLCLSAKFVASACEECFRGLNAVFDAIPQAFKIDLPTF